MKCHVCASWLVAAAVLAAALVGTESRAQEKAKEKKPALPPLPAYVSQVVTEKQKEEMYKLAEKYEPELDKLRAELRKLNAELQKIQKQRDGEITALLTDEQKARIKELAAQAKAKADANKKAKESAKPPVKEVPKEPAKEPEKK